MITNEEPKSNCFLQMLKCGNSGYHKSVSWNYFPVQLIHCRQTLLSGLPEVDMGYSSQISLSYCVMERSERTAFNSAEPTSLTRTLLQNPNFLANRQLAD
jgi:hypothetical protein